MKWLIKLIDERIWKFFRDKRDSETRNQLLEMLQPRMVETIDGKTYKRMPDGHWSEA